MKRITIGSKHGNELYNTGHLRASYYLNIRTRAGSRACYSNHDLTAERRSRELAPRIKAAMIDRRIHNHDLWADALNLATWNDEDAETTAQRVVRIMEAVA